MRNQVEVQGQRFLQRSIVLPTTQSRVGLLTVFAISGFFFLIILVLIIARLVSAIDGLLLFVLVRHGDWIVEETFLW